MQAVVIGGVSLDDIEQRIPLKFQRRVLEAVAASLSLSDLPDDRSLHRY